jgi:DNA mismatch repair ATPase MutS
MNESDKKKSFIIYHDWFELIENIDLSNEKTGILFKALGQYVRTGKIIDLKDHEDINALFQTFKMTIDRDTKKYLERCETNRKNRAKGNKNKK